jgi:hypothetical protein
VLVDSNYDWGQELILLSRHLHQLHADKVSLDCIDGVRQPAYLQVWYELPPIQLVDARSPAPGWSVICPTIDKAYRPDVLQTTGGAEPWYDRVAPTEYLGPLALYYTQPPSNSSAASEDNSSSLQ